MGPVNPFDWQQRYEAALGQCLLPQVAHAVFLKIQDLGLIDYTVDPAQQAMRYLMGQQPVQLTVEQWDFWPGATTNSQPGTLIDMEGTLVPYPSTDLD